jgi:hypothetical protein
MIYTNEMIEASKGARLCGMTEKEQVGGMRTMLYKLYEMRGLEPTEKDVLPTIQSIINEARSRYRGITMDEIALAFKYGVTENFGKDCRIIPSNLIMWLERYMTAPERLQALNDSRTAEKRQADALENNTADIERKNAEFRERAPRREWEKYKETGRLDIMFDGYAGAVYDALVERGKLRATDETKAKAREQARKELRSEYIRKRGGLAAHIGAGLDFGNNETLRTKRILLELYFRTLRQRGVELS